MGVNGTPLVFVTVGTDHHPFHRLIDWIDQWPARSMAEVVLQHGTGRSVAGADCHTLLDSRRMREFLAAADVVVCSGGPSTVMDARRAGRKPIVVPRRASLGEHVDDHQAAFGHHLASKGLATVVESFAELTVQLDRVFLDSAAHRISPSSAAPEGVRRVGEMIDALVRGRS